MKNKKIFLLLVLYQITMFAMSQTLTYNIRLNQIGFLPNSVKIAAVVNTQADSFKIVTSNLQQIVYEGQFLPAAYYAASDEDVKLAEFTLMTTPGEYVVVVDDIGKSVPFNVNANVFQNIAKSTLKSYYYNRASTPILSEFAGVWARDAGHADTAVVVLPSAATENRPAGTIISTPGGWYDAGDYNKYIVSSGISVFTILSAYETYSEMYDTLQINIPESNNNIPDILDEALYNIRWMMSMQDEDGGVYNKTTDANFGGFNMPANENATRYVTAKSTAATLDFTAIMAMTARIYKKYDPALADTALSQAKKAWLWAKANPNVAFNNPSGQAGYPGVNTGGYGDTGFDDEFMWCATELYITTKDDNYYNEIDFDQSYGVPGWPVVSSLGLLSFMANMDSLTAVADIDMIKSKFLNTTSGVKNNATNSPYRIPGDFYYWAGNNAFANWGMMFMQAFRVTGDASYFNAGVATLDYLLGKNATTYCFVTGHGSKSPMRIHHRISVADGVNDPVPGLLVCGANAGDQGDCGSGSYPSDLSAKCYLDEVCSYSTNEIAIGINSGLVFLTGAIQAEYLANFTDSMPRFFSVSTNTINLTYTKADPLPLVVQGNTDWELQASDEWITLSVTSGSGNSTILVNSNANNPSDDERMGKIYVYSQGELSDSVLVKQNGKTKSFRIEAEDYLDKFGTQAETTADEGGGENMGYVDVGNWLSYTLEITYEGLYDVTVRHAGWAGDIDFVVDGEFLSNFAFPKTADWQVWESHATEMEFTEGIHELKLEFNATGTNLNWYQFDWKEPNAVNTLKENALHVYPNPASKFLNVDLGSNAFTGELQVLTIEGKTLLSQNISGTALVTVDVSSLERGMYILKVNNNNAETISKTLIIE